LYDCMLSQFEDDSMRIHLYFKPYANSLLRFRKAFYAERF
jgi:hypothetical protein